MRNFLSISIFLFSFPSLAFVDISLTTKVNIKTFAKVENKGFHVTCNPLASGEDESLGPYTETKSSFDANGSYNTNFSVENLIKSRINYTRSKQGGTGADFVARKTKFTGTKEVNGNSTTIVVEIDDDSIQKQEFGNPNEFDSCITESETWQAITDKNIFDGRITISYQVPDHTYLVKVTRSELTQLFNRKFTGPIHGGLNSDSYDLTLKGEEYIWVRPGAKLEQTFKWDSYNPAPNTKSLFKINFEPVRSQQLNDIQANTSKIISTLAKNALPFLDSGFSATNVVPNFFDPLDLSASDFLYFMVGLAQNDELIQRLYLELDHDFFQYLVILKELSIAQFSSQSLLAPHLKMAASLLSFKLGLEMLKSIAPLCTNINKVDAFTGESSQDLLLFHLINTLEFLQQDTKADKYGYFEVFIEYLKQSNHGTYRELRKGIPQKNFEKIQQTIASIDSHGLPMQKSEYAIEDLLNEDKILQQHIPGFSSFKDKFNRGAQLEPQVRDLIYHHLLLLRKNSDQIVSIDELTQKFDELIQVRRGFLSDLNNISKRLGITKMIQSGSLPADILKISLDNVRLFSDEKNFEYDAPFYEPIRKELIATIGTKKAISQANQCLTQGFFK